MDQILGALAEPWARRWSGHVAGAALAFWAAGLIIYVARAPISVVACPAAATSPYSWCRIGHAGPLGAVVTLVAVAAAVIGSAFIVAALSPRLVYLLAGDGWPIRGPVAATTAPVRRWLLRRQADRRGRIAAAGTPVPDAVPVIPEGKDRRRRAHRAIASYAADMQTDRAAAAALRRYPAGPGAVGLTRPGSALAAMNERVWRRHGLDLLVCWEPLLAALPPDARECVTRESTRVTLQGQNVMWAFSAIVWTPLFGMHWAAMVWVLALLVLVRVLYAGLCSAMETYCDLIEATVAVHRHRLYRTLGLALPPSTACEPAAGIALSAYLSGHRTADVPLSWPAEEPAEGKAGTAAQSAAELLKENG